MVFLLVFEIMDFVGFILGFHGHVEPCRICSLYSDLVLVVYMYVYMCGLAANLVWQVAVCGFCVCFCCFVLGSVLFWIETNLIC